DWFCEQYLFAPRTASVAGQTTAGAQQQQQKEHVAQTCEDLPPAQLKGTTTLLNSISCDPPMLLHVKENALLRSNGVVDTKGIHFTVHEHGSLTVHASAVEIKRTKVRAFTRFFV
ncbi:unnamed protein product, partial [Ectocarpus sp. 12 AP-2014]